MSKHSKYEFYVDQPLEERVYEPKLDIAGWFFPTDGRKVKKMRVRIGESVWLLKYGGIRTDVAIHFKQYPKELTLNSGFSATVDYDEGDAIIEADFGKGYETIHTIKLENHIGKSQDKVNSKLGRLWRDHLDTMKVKEGYYKEAAAVNKVVNKSDRGKLIAFYLPQFHPIAENDHAWGKGFTEWTNVTAAVPRYVGHHQPMLPGDLGFYDLRYEENIKAQIDLAKNAGIYGFCFYYYWFSGKKILDMPINSFLKNKDWDFNFSICWANENWTKRWDGLENEVILEQKYLKSDPLDFIKEVENILLDKRYITFNGKPMLLVYRPEHTGNPKQYVKVWRDYFKKTHKKDLHIVSVMSFSDTDPAEFGMDAGVEFVPSVLSYISLRQNGQQIPRLELEDKMMDKNFSGIIYDYKKAVMNDEIIDYEYPFPTYKSVAPSWDNDARKKGAGACFYGASPDLYEMWLRKSVNATTKERPFVFINAWNEWAEGTVLEPTRLYGHAYLNRTAKVIDELGKKSPAKGAKKGKLAVLIHLYHIDLWGSIADKLQALDGVDYDLHISLQPGNEKYAKKLKEQFPDNLNLYFLPNRGRDILPFIHILRKLSDDRYAAILKLHTKKSLHRSDGADWFEELLDKLLPSKEIAAKYVDKVTNEKAAIVPAGHLISVDQFIGTNIEKINEFMDILYPNRNPRDMKHTPFISGSMYYANLEALKPLLNLYLSVDDFETEDGQVDGTTAHAIERLLGLVMKNEGVKIYKTSAKGLAGTNRLDIVKHYKYAKG